MQEVIKKAITDALKSLNIEGVDFVVDHPTDIHMDADYFSNVAMAAAKIAGEAPRTIAQQLSAALQGKIDLVDSIEVAGPGFLNFNLNRVFFTTKIKEALEMGDNWGQNNQCESQTVLIEYTSPNLFKPLHIGNLVGNIIGESLSRLFEFSGAEVKRINYPSDIGLTVAKAVWGLQKTGGNPEDIEALGVAYRTGSEAYENDESDKAEIIAVNQALYTGEDVALMELRAKGIATSRAKLAAICAKLGTSFDTEIFESEVDDKGVEIVHSNIDGVFEKSDGAVVYRGEKAGLHTRVFINSKGLPTYEAKDLGNFVTKQSQFPNWDTSIVVTGNEQTEYFKVLYAAINELYPDTVKKNLEHIPTGFLTLTTGKMSSRKGGVLTGESLLAEMETAATERAAETRAEDVEQLAEEIAVAALKYQILRQQVGSDMVFDKEKSLSFEGDSGPYLQYTHARISSVLKKAVEESVSGDTTIVPPAPYQIEKLLYQFPTAVTESIENRSPHKLVHYLTELAGEFNSFYAHEKIADKDDEFAPYKVAITELVQITLKNGLWMLGCEAPEQM